MSPQIWLSMTFFGPATFFGLSFQSVFQKIDSNQLIGELNRFNSRLKRLSRELTQLTTLVDPQVLIQIDSWLKRKTFDSESTHDSTLSRAHVCPMPAVPGPDQQRCLCHERQTMAWAVQPALPVPADAIAWPVGGRCTTVRTLTSVWPHNGQPDLSPFHLQRLSVEILGAYLNHYR